MAIQVGLRDLYYSIMTKDETTGTAYATPVKIAGAINAKISPKTDTETLFADDGPSETASSLGQVDVELEVKDIGLDDQAALLGHTVTGGVMVKKSTDLSPYVAIGFKSIKSNGNYRYVWLYKGRFDTPDQEYQTKEDKPSFQTPTIKGTFIRRDHDNAWQKIADEDHPDYVSTIGKNWFTAVDTPDTVPPSISTVVPANNATAVEVSAVITWTFSEAILVSSVIPANFLVQQADGTAQVAGTLSMDATHKVVTFTPTSDLDAGTTYMTIVGVGVKDLAGNALATPHVTKFTTK
jgi:phi13 family phage major tail protein